MNEDEVLDYEAIDDYRKPEIEIVELNKFILLTFMSVGLYELWWIYKSWKFFKEKDSLDIQPALRAVFAIFFLYSLFEKIKSFANQFGYGTSYSSVFLVVVIFVLNLLARLPHPYWIVGFGAVCCFIPPVNALNYAIKNSGQYTAVDGGYNSRQILIVVLGSIFWILAVIGFMTQTRYD